VGKHRAPEPKNWLDVAVERDKRRTPHGRCVDVADGMDGFVIHAETCPNAGRAWLSSSNCVKLSRYNGVALDWMKK
jgi:hypothetical protein